MKTTTRTTSLVAGLLLTFVVGTSPASAREFHVSPSGDDAHDGSAGKMLKTISAAAKVAQPGDLITVHEGVYRERVNPPRGGASAAKRIVYQAAKGEKVVIKGSEVVKGWQKVGNDTWKVKLANSFFGGFNPYSDYIEGEWHTPIKEFPKVYTGNVYCKGKQLVQSPDKRDVLKPVGPKCLWFGQVDDATTTIWAQFENVDPNKDMVEINVRQSIFYPDKPGRNYITVRGFTMRHAATPWAGAMSDQIGLVGTHWSKGWIIEDNVISHSTCTGITLGRYGLDETPPPTMHGWMKALFTAVDDGWTKDDIGSHIVRNNHISYCWKNGIHGSLGGIFSTIEGNIIHDIALNAPFNAMDHAGIKLLGSLDCVISNNHIYRCGGYGGVWLDWMAQGTRFTGNLLHDNRRDLFVEVNHGPFLVDNNIFLSPAGLLESSGGGAYVHNLFGCQVKLRGEPDRATPYHKPHSAIIAGISKVIGDDERFHNNIFVGEKGLVVYDAWKATNVQAVGNVHLAGSKPHSHEQSSLINEDVNPEIKVQEKPDGWWLEMSIDSTMLKKQNRTMVTTDLLGTAKIPNAKFEQPDGAPYRLDTDYFGGKRTANPAPGPFEISGRNKIHLKVWPKN